MTASSNQSLRLIALELQELNVQYSKLLWTQYTTGLDFGVQESLLKISDFKKDKTRFKAICNERESAKDSLHRREAQILWLEFKSYHYSDKANAIQEKIEIQERDLMALINQHRAQIDGREVSATERGEILRNNPDRELRRKAFESLIPLNKKLIDNGFLDLTKLRQDLAQACGAADFVTMKLEESELSPEIFKGWKEQCARVKDRLKARRAELAQKYLGYEDLKSWDKSYLGTKLCQYNETQVNLSNFKEPISKTFKKFGFDMESMNLTFDIFPRKNKSEWGYNFTIVPGSDSRILANVSNKFSDYWVLLHETAHGVHFLGLNPDEIILNQNVSGIVAEGFANFFGNLSYSREFLEEIFPAQEMDHVYSELKRYSRYQALDSFNSIMITLFDQELYRHDIKSLDDINQLYWTLTDELLGRKPETPEPIWGRTIHHTSHPIYLHNYFLGDVMCENMKHVFKSRFGVSADESPLEFGQFWRNEVLAPSGRYPLPELYERVCGEPINITPFLESCLEPG